MANIVHNLKKKGIELTFDSKPEADILRWLKDHKFRWSSFAMVWWRKFDENIWYLAHQYFNIPLLDQPEQNKERPSAWIEENTQFTPILSRIKEKHPDTKADIAEQFDLGRKIEAEHTNNATEAIRIAYDHLWEDPEYYTKAKPKNWAEKELKEEKEKAMIGIPKGIEKDVLYILGLHKSKSEGKGTGGMDLSLFKASLYGRLKTMKKNGEWAKVDAILDYLDEKNKALKLKPVFTANHGIWRLRSEKKVERPEVKPEPKPGFFRETSIYTPPKHAEFEAREKRVGFVRPEFMNDPAKYPLIKGRMIQISMPNGEKRNSQFVIVELENIIASHNEENFHSEPLFPKNAAGNNINDRNYKDDLSAQKAVMDYARELEPERLITTSRTPSGTPIITKDGFVVSGNNRAMSMKLAAKKYPDNYKAYVQFLAEEIESFGFTGHQGTALLMNDRIPIEGSSYDDPKAVKFNYPALVRIDLDFTEYTTQELAKYNKDTKKSERPVDKAIKLSNILRENSRCAEIIAEITGESDTFSEFYSNIAGQKKLAKTLVECNLLTEQELPAYFSETTFTEAGKEFIENLLAALILDREALLATEQPGVKVTRQKLITSLPVLMKNASLPEGSLKKNINDAVILQQIIKTSGSEFGDFIRQQNLFGTKYDRKTVYLNRLIDSGKMKFKQAIEGYNDAIMKNQGASLFGDKPTNEQIFDHWIKDNASETDQRLIEASEVVSKEVTQSEDYIFKLWSEYAQLYPNQTSQPDYIKFAREKGLPDELVDRLYAFNAKYINAPRTIYKAKSIQELEQIKAEDEKQLAESRPQREAFVNKFLGRKPELRKEFLKEQDRLKIYLVDGEAVRKEHIEFVSGGHGYVYDWIPKDEVWIDDNQKDKPADMEATIKHELFEIGKMRDEGLSYEDAHELANAMEKEVRNESDELPGIPKTPETTKSQILDVFLPKVKIIKPFISQSQLDALTHLYRSEEKEAAVEIATSLADIIEKMPHTYQTEKTEIKDKIVWLHYFIGGSDWYIVEKDSNGDQSQMFGYAILNGDYEMAEWGYVSAAEIKENNMELDFYWTPKKFSEVSKKWKEQDDTENEEDRKVYGYSFNFDPANEEGLQLVTALEDFNIVTIHKSDAPNVINLKKGNEYELLDNSGEFKINRVGSEGYPYVIDFKDDNGKLKSIHQLAKEIEDIIIDDLTKPEKTSPVVLPTLEYNGKTYFIDFKLQEIRDKQTAQSIKFTEITSEELKSAIRFIRSEKGTSMYMEGLDDETINIFPEGLKLEQIKTIDIASLITKDYKNPFELNKAIEALLDEKWSDPVEKWSADELEFLSGYSGYGGLDEYGAISVASLFEFYTPEKVIEKMWALAYKYGYKEGRMCEPSAGIGLFMKREYVKSMVIKDAYEINKYSAKICKLLYPEANINDGTDVKYFEQLFIKNNYTVRDKIKPVHELVIGNPPYGEAAGLYMGMGEKSYTKAKNYIDYFIFRGLDLLVPGGLLIYIIGAEVAGGGTPWLDQGTSKCKELIQAKGKLIDAYRLPEGLFARTNVVTDIIIFRKK